MNWLLLTIFSVFIASLAGILQKVLMKGDKSNPYSYAIVFHLLLGIVNALFSVFHGFQFPSLNGNIMYLLLASALWGGTTIFLFKALQLLEASEVTILSSVRVIITIIASLIFLHESFNSQKILGTLLILFSILLVTNLKKGIKLNKGVLYVCIMALLSGLAIVVDSFNVKQYDVLSYNALTNFLIGGMLVLFYPKVLTQWEHFITPHFLKKMIPLGIFSSLQGTAYLLALTTGGNTAQVATIRQTTVIVTVILAVVFLQERDNVLRKICAAILVALGVVLVS